MSYALVTLTNPHSPAAEAYQSLRTNIEFSRLDRELRSLLVTSADTDTAKSLTLANLAVVLAQAGDRVLVVDGDLRRPQQHQIFKLPNSEGLTSWLEAGGELTPHTTTVERLQVITSGPLPQNPAALLGTARLAALLAQLADRADYILCDAPPVLAVTDAALWASKVDGVVLAINAGRTKREHAQRAKSILERVHAHILGAVLVDAEVDGETNSYYGPAPR